jgi:ribose 5-phosphate isomerase A
MNSHKKNAAGIAAKYVKDGMTIGLGTGSTVQFFLEELAELIDKEKFSITGVCTSSATEHEAQKLRIPIVSLQKDTLIDLTVDGADEIDNYLNLIKGGGGALYREKLIAKNSKKVVIIADESKKVDVLGAFPLPIEITKFGNELIQRKIEDFLPSTSLRKNADGTIFETDNNNYILDCKLEHANSLLHLEQELKLITGVVETGLFINVADVAIVNNNKIEKDESQYA